MGSDIDKAIELLMTMLAGKDNQKEEPPQEEYNEISAEDNTEETVPAEENDNSAHFSNLLGEFTGGNDKRVTLLSSIKPYMSGKRQEKVDAAINIVRILSVSSTLGLGKLFDIR